MKFKLAIVIAAGAITFMPVMAMSQTQTQKGSETSHPDMRSSDKINKETDARKNGASQSESPAGENKNGQPQQR